MFSFHIKTPNHPDLPLHTLQAASSIFASWVKRLVQTDPDPTSALFSVLNWFDHQLEISALRTGSRHSLLAIAVYPSKFQEPLLASTNPNIVLPAPIHSGSAYHAIYLYLQKDLHEFSSWRPLRDFDFHITALPDATPLPMSPALFQELPVGDTPVNVVLSNAENPLLLKTTVPSSDIAQLLLKTNSFSALNIPHTSHLVITTQHHLSPKTRSSRSDLFFTFSYYSRTGEPTSTFDITFAFEIDASNSRVQQLLENALLLSLLAYRQLQAVSSQCGAPLQMTPYHTTTPSEPHNPLCVFASSGFNDHFLRWDHASSPTDLPALSLQAYLPSISKTPFVYTYQTNTLQHASGKGNSIPPLLPPQLPEILSTIFAAQLTC